MAAVFLSTESDVNFGEVGEYQQFPRPGSETETETTAVAAAAEKTPKLNLTHLRVVGLSFGVLCVLQVVLNISLRLTVTHLPETNNGEAEEVSCPQGWLMFGSSCYYISSQRRTWDQSRQDCLQRDADLVIIDDRQEQAFLTGFTMAAWVGMTDREKEGTWIWVDGTPVNKDSLLWAPGQPDGAFGGEDCGDLRTMMSFIGLNDFNCSARVQWICEKALIA